MPPIRAAVLHAANEPMKIETLDLAPPGPREVMVRMSVAGVCHSDLHVIKGELRQRLPIVLGHEGAGIVEAVGAEVKSVRPGQRVVLSWIPSCGECYYCQHDQAHLCDNGDPLARSSRLSLNGAPVSHFLSTSAFAEAVVVPEGGVIPIPDDIPLQTAALVSCGVATGIGAVLNSACVEPGASVAVFGCGGVGLNIHQGAKLAAADPIIAVDRVPAKLDTARRFGATHTVDASGDANVPDAIRALTEGRGADYAFEAIGQTSVLQTAFSAVRKGGKVIVVGLPPVDQRMDIRGCRSCSTRSRSSDRCTARWLRASGFAPARPVPRSKLMLDERSTALPWTKSIPPLTRSSRRDESRVDHLRTSIGSPKIAVISLC
jgi:Zn-dependent alcohol dehydrogenase